MFDIFLLFFFIVKHPYICKVLKIFVRLALVQFYLVFIQFSFALSKKESKFTYLAESGVAVFFLYIVLKKKPKCMGFFCYLSKR